MKKIFWNVFIFLIGSGFLLPAGYLFFYFGKFDGDPLIHVRYAEMGSRGAWFQFNAAEVTSGVTSFLWMFFGSAGWRVGGIKGCLFLYDFIIILSWVGGAVILGFLVHRWCSSFRISLLASVVFLGYPGIAANGLTGMENMTFAFLVFVFVFLYCLRSDRGYASEKIWVILLGFVLGLQILTRPEGIVIALGYAFFELIRFFKEKNRKIRKRILIDLLVVALLSSAIVIPAWGFHFAVTGKVVPGSGIARLMSARRMATAVHVAGPIWVYLRTLIRLATFFPLLMGLGWGLFPRKFDSAPSRQSKKIHSADSIKLSLLIVFSGIIFYTLITGALHVNRYTIWIFGLATAVFFVQVDRLIFVVVKNRSRLGAALILTALFWISLGQWAEGLYRIKRGDHIKLKKRDTIVEGVENRKPNTDRLLSLLEWKRMERNETQVGVLLQEVQLRLIYDDRIKVFSRDGRTTSLLYGEDGCPDLRPILEDSSLEIIMDNINEGTTKGCIGDPDLMELVRLYEIDRIRKTAGWEKIWYEDYPRFLMYDDTASCQEPFPLLVKSGR